MSLGGNEYILMKIKYIMQISHFVNNVLECKNKWKIASKCIILKQDNLKM